MRKKHIINTLPPYLKIKKQTPPPKKKDIQTNKNKQQAKIKHPLKICAFRVRGHNVMMFLHIITTISKRPWTF